jgi:hypothetical protein
LHDARDQFVEAGQLPARQRRGRSIKDQERESLVYYGRARDVVKIGSTYSPARRWDALRREHGAFEVLVVEAGGQQVEYQRHAQFVRDRVGMTEWFRWTPDLSDHVEQLHAANPQWRVLVEQAHSLAAKGPALRYV